VSSRGERGGGRKEGKMGRELGKELGREGFVGGASVNLFFCWKC
jgi:hypothetical protein